MAVLSNSLIAYWALEDVNDSHGGSLHLSNIDTVNFGAGKVGNAAFFNGTSEYLVRTGVTPPGAMTVAFWTSPTSDVFQAYIAQYNLGVNQSWTIFSFTDLGYFCRIHSEATGAPVWIGRYGGDIITGTWQFVVVTYDGGSAASGIKIYLNSSQSDTTDSNSGSFTSQVVSSGHLSLAGQLNAGNLEIPLAGAMDEVGWWGRVLNSAEITWLYNGGAGRSYSAVLSAGDVSGGETNPIFWRMTDIYGTP